MIQPTTLRTENRTLLFIFLCVLAVYGLTCYNRQAGYNEWMQSRSDYVVEGVTAMSTTDAYHWIRMARDLDAQHLGKGLIDPLKGYPDLDEYTERPSLLAYLISFAGRFTNGDYYRAGQVLVTLLAGLFVFPLLLYFQQLGFGAAAVLGGLIGSFSIAYHGRSNHGYVDTDMLNLFFPLTVSALMLLLGRERSLRVNMALAAGAGACMFLFCWWYQQPSFFLIYLVFMGIYLLAERFPPRRAALLLLVYALISGPHYVMESFTSLQVFLKAYFFPQPSGQIVWPDIMLTISEAAKLDLITKLKRVHAFLPIPLAGLLGLLYLCLVRGKKMIPAAPLLLVGVWSLLGPRRFSMYLAPFVGVGVGVLIQLVVQYATGKTGMRTFAKSLVSVALMAGLFFATLGYTAYGIIPGSIPRREIIQAIFDIKKRVPEHAAMLAWWDEGYPLMDLGGFATYHDGAQHGGARTTLIARAFASSRQEDMVSLLAYLEESGFEGLNTAIVEENLSGEALLQRVFGYPSGIKGDNVYVLLTDKMMGEFGSVSLLGTWDFADKTSSPMRYDLLHCFSQSGDLLVCREGRVDLTQGKVFDDTHFVPLKAILTIQDGAVINRVDYPTEEGSYLQIVMKEGRVLQTQILEERLFRSNYNQLFLLGNFDRRYFEEVYNNFPVARVLKVRASVPPQ